MTMIRTQATSTICQADGMWITNNKAAIPALTAPPILYMAWQVLISNLLYFFSIRFTVALEDTPFKKPVMPKQYKHAQNMGRLIELISKIMIKQEMV